MTTDTGLIERAEKFLALAEKATAAPWVNVDGGPMHIFSRGSAPGQGICDMYRSEVTDTPSEDAENNSDFIKAARNDAPSIIRALLTELSRAPEAGWVWCTDMDKAPKDGRWIVAVSNDWSDVYRVSWGVDCGGRLRWCSTNKSYGDGLFGGWAACPQSPPAASPAPAQATDHNCSFQIDALHPRCPICGKSPFTWATPPAEARDSRCTCGLVRRAIKPEEHDDSCPVVAAAPEVRG